MSGTLGEYTAMVIPIIDVSVIVSIVETIGVSHGVSSTGFVTTISVTGGALIDAAADRGAAVGKFVCVAGQMVV